MKRIKLEDFIKGKVEKASFPYQEGAWEHAAEQFATWDAERRRRRRFVFLLLPILLGFALMTWRFWPASEAADQAVAMNSHAVDAILPLTPSSPYSSKSQSNSTLSPAVNPVKSSIPTPQKQRYFSPKKVFRPQSTANSNHIAMGVGELQKNPVLSQRTASAMHQATPAIDEVSWMNVLLQAESSISSGLYAQGKTPFKRLSPYLELGTALYKGFANETITRPAPAASPLIGAGILYRLNRSLRLKAGIQYMQRTQLNHVLKQQELTFGFIQQNREVWWSPEKLHFLQLPVELQLRTFARQRFLLGGQLGYLLATQGSLTTQNTSFYEPAPPLESEPAPSYVTGISLWDASAHFGYELRWSPRCATGLRYHWGMRDLMKDDIFQANGMNRNTRLSFTITYNF